MYIQRDIDKALIVWKTAWNRKPLLLRGVRQCGKTSAVRHFADQFENYVEINFEENERLQGIFDRDFDVHRILTALELEAGKRILPGKTLLFLDEIQTCPRAITALRYFYEQMPELHVIAAGSLLEILLNGKRRKDKLNFPVGRVRSMFLYPLSFSEFLRGTGNEMLCDYLSRENEMPPSTHERLIEIYKSFLVIGGMPEAVSAFLDTGSILESQKVHRDIVMNFMDDFQKYDSPVPPDVLKRVFDFAAHHVCSQVKSSSAVEGVSAYIFDESIDLLHRAGLIHPVKASSCDVIPLGSTGKGTNKKLILFDTGVYLTHCGLDAASLMASQIFDEMNRGNIVEMEVGLELIKSSDSHTESDLYYWYRSGANAEVDYVIQAGGNILPIEVKASGKGSMQSLRSYLSSHTLSPFGVRVSLENYGSYDDIRVCPVYSAHKIRDISI